MSEVALASQAELTAIRALLEHCGLPTSDLDCARPQFVVVHAGAQAVAAGALQRFGSAALLRSVVVSPNLRGRGLGRRVVLELERLARTVRIDEIVLLTERASDFFARQGYRIIARESAPEDVRQCEEFRSLCPSSATCMTKRLADVAGAEHG